MCVCVCLYVWLFTRHTLGAEASLLYMVVKQLQAGIIVQQDKVTFSLH